MAKDKPYYPHSSISSIDTLAKCLGVAPKVMLDLARDTENSYTEFVVPSKGKDRTVYDPKHNLKKIQKRINSRIFEHVLFPEYLQGGIRDVDSPRDHVNNGRAHTGSSVLVSLDIRNFYDNIKYPSVFDVFKNFFKFPDEVSKVLADLVTFRGKVPQGACTSSYVANLVFHNTEYSVVSYLKSRGIQYTRLLDDVALSSNRVISKADLEGAIEKVAGMFKRHKLRIHPRKKKIEYSSDSRSEYKVTGVWVAHGVPKLRRKDRDYIRHLVHICELEFLKDPTADSYHELWNRSSAQVAQMTRLGHSQAASLRSRMSEILPLYGPSRKTQLNIEVKKLLGRKQSESNSLGFIRTYHKLINALGILSRTDRGLARSYRGLLTAKFPHVRSKVKYWEQ
ncbi:RNA-directed DNA polymerase [Pseudomonas taiwanensis]|uniref:reverse transcriptase family protein n=1 Tax=Pseudomonas taiwanensis TaxID=470150 RepID=UPI0015BF7979|nr:reverse transcriptase family protein [Pseudomonas taiwanensis]NWL75492.1 RNA-directed DNA polymerase [Pseudomonas taiwanensis]